MVWDNNLVNLRNLLAGLYWDRIAIHRIVTEVGLRPEYISFSDKPINTWHSVIEEAYGNGKVKDLIISARKQYPSNQSLKMAESDQLLGVPAPELPDNEWRGPKEAGQLEQIIGAESTLLPISFLERGIMMSQPVARVIREDRGRGTGFLIEGDLLVTAHHIIPTVNIAEGVSVCFNYQTTLEGYPAETEEYKLIPEEGFVTSPSTENEGDDWTAVRVKGYPCKKWGNIRLESVGVKEGDRAIIIQHPGGGYKHIAFYHNTIVKESSSRIYYLTDTIEGSSGSPVFNDNWQLIGLHHKGGVYEKNAPRLSRWRNQGIRINLVIENLHKSGLC